MDIRLTKKDGMLKKSGIEDGWKHVSTMPSGHKVYHDKGKKSALWAAVKDGDVHQRIMGTPTEDGHFKVNIANGLGDASVKAHDLYHHMITHHGVTIRSDDYHTKGGRSIWKSLSENPDIEVSRYKFDGKPIKMHTGRDFSKNYQGPLKKSYFVATSNKKAGNETI